MKKKRVVKVYFCPMCARRTPYEKGYSVVICRRCCCEMVVREDAV